MPKLHAACKMDFEKLSIADGVKVRKEHKMAYIVILDGVRLYFEMQDEIILLRAVTLSTVL